MGNVGLAINQDTTSINDFLSPECDFLRDIVRSSYTRSKCYHLHSVIDLNQVLNILGERAYELNNQQLNGLPQADLLDIELLEEIAWNINERFLALVTLPNKTQTRQTKAQILNLPRLKIRRANKQL